MKPKAIGAVARVLSLIAGVVALAGSVGGIAWVFGNILAGRPDPPDRWFLPTATVGAFFVAVSAWIAQIVKSRSEVDAITQRVAAAQGKLDRPFDDELIGFLRDANIRVEGHESAEAAQPLSLLDESFEEKLEKLAELADDSRVQPAWDVARGTLEKYWSRNLNQNGVIFWMSILASLFGFSVTVWGVSSAIRDHAATTGSILAAASGAVTQVIGATFLVIYRSTAQQGLAFNRTLERINSVGMAWYILQTMAEGSAEERAAKDAAKAALATAVSVAGGNAAPTTPHS